jgi:ABC-type sugar transport system permease subunit
LLAGLQTVPEDVYEQGDIDGINAWQSLVHITLPLIRPQMAIVVIMITIGSLNQIDSILSITRGGPGRATETLAMAIYREGFTFFDASFAATLSMLLLLLNLVLTIFYFYALRQKGELIVA